MANSGPWAKLGTESGSGAGPGSVRFLNKKLKSQKRVSAASHTVANSGPIGH